MPDKLLKYLKFEHMFRIKSITLLCQKVSELHIIVFDTKSNFDRITKPIL